jgi:hypothetical protein
MFCFGKAQGGANTYANLFRCEQGQFPIRYLDIPIHHHIWVFWVGIFLILGLILSYLITFSRFMVVILKNPLHNYLILHDRISFFVLNPA